MSIGTVSMALNDKDGVSNLYTTADSRCTARELGYRRPSGRNQGASSFVSLVIERLPLTPSADAFNRPILIGLESMAQSAGYRIAMEFAGPEDEPETGLRSQNSSAGIVVLGGGDLRPGWIRTAAQSDTPVVMVDHFVPGLEIPTVVPDNLGGAYSATRHLLDAGHRRIGFIRGPSKYWTLSERMAGYLLAVQQSDLSVDSALVPPRVSHGEEKGYGEMKHLLALPEPPTAVFAVSDKTALGAYRAVTDQGLAIPEDISIVGFDDIGEARSLNPPLTTVQIAGETMGRMAFHRLLGLISNGEPSESIPLKWTIPTKLVKRGSARDHVD